MDGDGGVIASNRRYMRGAGTADHTADSLRSRGEKQVSDREAALERMRARALTKAPPQSWRSSHSRVSLWTTLSQGNGGGSIDSPQTTTNWSRYWLPRGWVLFSKAREVNPYIYYMHVWLVTFTKTLAFAAQLGPYICGRNAQGSL